MNTDYITLFKERKWLEGFDSLPLNQTKIIDLEPKDFVIIRVRASDFNKSGSKKVSVTIDYDNNKAALLANKK